MKEEQPVFKVTDRRLFNADGTPRDTSPDEKGEPIPVAAPQEEAAPTESPIASSKPSQAAAPLDEDILTAGGSQFSEEPGDEMELDDTEIADAADPASFINFAMSIASNAASALGLMEHPVSRKREVDLELGKHWIDVLGMLEKKTQGNLTPQEAQIVEGWLADLRMQFVSLTRASATKAAGFTGRDIIGGK
jgi:hypothetical protein